MVGKWEDRRREEQQVPPRVKTDARRTKAEGQAWWRWLARSASSHVLCLHLTRLYFVSHHHRSLARCRSLHQGYMTSWRCGSSRILRSRSVAICFPHTGRLDGVRNICRVVLSVTEPTVACMHYHEVHTMAMCTMPIALSTGARSFSTAPTLTFRRVHSSNRSTMDITDIDSRRSTCCTRSLALGITTLFSVTDSLHQVPRLTSVHRPKSHALTTPTRATSVERGGFTRRGPLQSTPLASISLLSLCPPSTTADIPDTVRSPRMRAPEPPQAPIRRATMSTAANRSPHPRPWTMRIHGLLQPSPVISSTCSLSPRRARLARAMLRRRASSPFRSQLSESSL